MAPRVASQENRLTRLAILIQVAIGILALLLGSQAALWAKFGILNGQMSRVVLQLDQIARAVGH